MATTKLTERYMCYDDCRAEGCPEHDANLEFNTVSNAYTFDNGKGESHFFEQGELEAMINLLKRLSEIRADSLKV